MCASYDSRPLDADHRNKRLIVSVWHQDVMERSKELIGALSFGLGHLVAKCERDVNGVSGWYYLLAEELGHRKHVLVNRKLDVDDDKENQQAAYIQVRVSVRVTFNTVTRS